jgi:hypothetical protein
MIPMLLRAYPRAWRAEYGEELASVLAARPLSVWIVANVLWNGFRERLRRRHPGSFFGKILLHLTLYANLSMLGAKPEWSDFLFHWFGAVPMLLAATAAASALHRGGNSARAWLAEAFRTVLLGTLPNLVFCLFWAVFILPLSQSCGAGVPGCGMTTLFLQSSAQPTLFELMFSLGVNVVLTGLIGGLAGAAVGSITRLLGRRAV